MAWKTQATPYTVDAWILRLQSEAQSRQADCCTEGMTEEEKADSIQDMLLDFCHEKGVQDHLIGQVALALNCYH